MSCQHKRYLTLCGIGLHSTLPRELADGQITLLVNSMISLKLDITLEEEETAQVYQFDHVGQGLAETLV